MKAMILAAGLGTRLKPFTDHHPKALAVVNGKTILQRNIEYLQQFKVDKIIINVHHFADQIISFLQENNNFNIDIQISDETQEVLETGGGLLKAKWFFEPNESFVLMNVDILTDMNLQEMLQKHTSSKAIATLAISRRESARCFLFNDDLQLCGWRNKQKQEEKISLSADNYTEFAFSGIHIINSIIFQHISQVGKFSMVDVYLDLCKKHVIKGYDHSGTHFLDVGKPDSILKAETIFN
jgi:NDP-sugar pyrophosphorylase family protein